MKTGFYIGRFQPLHNGHMSAIKNALKEVDKLIIGIGSPEKCYTRDNPFTAGERVEMITSALEGEGISTDRYLIIHIRDIEKYGMWVSHVEILCPKFEIVYTGSPITKMLFEKNKGYEVREVSKDIDVSATKVREELLNEREWEELVPESVSGYLKKIDAVKRIKDVEAKD